MPIIAVKNINPTVFKAPICPPILINKNISKAGRPINKRKMGSFVWYKNIWLMYIYQIMSNSFGYLDIITRHDRRIYHFAATKYTRKKNWSWVKGVPGLQKNSIYTKNEIKPVKQNLDILEGNDKKEFLRGAEIAYESILTSFANGDLIKLKSLLSSNMFSNFSDH